MVGIGIFLGVALRGARAAGRSLKGEGGEGHVAVRGLQAQTAGGFDPVPEFSATSAELRFRGASCLRELTTLEANLYRICAGA
jgi:hypothetical protein